MNIGNGKSVGMWVINLIPGRTQWQKIHRYFPSGWRRLFMKVFLLLPEEVVYPITSREANEWCKCSSMWEWCVRNKCNWIAG